MLKREFENRIRELKMIPDDIDTGLAKPGEAYRALMSSILPVYQLTAISAVDHMTASKAKFILGELTKLAHPLSAHADHYDSHEDKIQQLDQLINVLDQIIQKEGVKFPAYDAARYLKYHIQQLRDDYHIRYIRGRNPLSDYSGPVSLRVVKDGS